MKIISTLVILFFFTNILFAQNVGIGTTTPTRARLELNGGVGRTAAIFGGDAPGVSIQKDYPAIGFNQYFDASASKFIGTGYANSMWQNPSTGQLNFDAFDYGSADATATGTRVLSITRLGKIGVGNVTPNGDLQFSNALNTRKVVLYEGGNNDNQFYGFGVQNATLTYNVDAPAAAHKFYAGNNASSSTLLMSIQGNKKVLIGQQAQGFKLGINSYDPVYTLEMVQSLNGIKSLGMLWVDSKHSYENWELVADHSVGGSTLFYLRFNDAIKGFFDASDGSYSTYSDRRLKKNIQNIPSVLDKVLKLKPVKYQIISNNPNGKESLGFVAQEVKEQFPDLVSIAEEESSGASPSQALLAINYSGFGVLAIKAIQEQQTQIDALQKEMAVLKEQNKLLLQLIKQ